MKTTKLFFRLNLMLFAAVLSFLSCNKAEAQGQGRQVPYGGSKMQCGEMCWPGEGATGG